MVKKKKDFGEHDKKTAARERKAATQKETRERTAKDEEDRFWAEAGDGALTKAQAKRKQQEQQRLETQARKQELKLLAKEEEDSFSKSKKPKGKLNVPKVTQHALMLERERAAAEEEMKLKERQMVERKEVDEETYAKMVDIENVNRQDTDVEARNVTDAIVALQKLKPNEDAQPEDLHPEKRRKAAYKNFYERELVELREEKPGLKLSQYKDLIFKRWLKSPENPMNQLDT